LHASFLSAQVVTSTLPRRVFENLSRAGNKGVTNESKSAAIFVGAPYHGWRSSERASQSMSIKLRKNLAIKPIAEAQQLALPRLDDDLASPNVGDFVRASENVPA